MKWARKSPLRVDWYEMAVELIGKNEADAIQANHGGGGNKECLRKVLSKWWNSTKAVDCHWQTIYDALMEVEQVRVAENIIDKCCTAP